MILITYRTLPHLLTRRYKPPKKVEDLDDVYINNDQRRTQHESYLHRKLSLYCEDDAKSIFSCVGSVTKIPRSTNKTFDFEIKSKSIVFEVTQINLAISNIPEDQSNKIQKTMAHIGKKESNASAIRGGVVWYDPGIAHLTNLLDLLQDENFIITQMKEYDLSFILFLSKSVPNLNPDVDMLHPSLFYVRKKHVMVFDCIISKITPVTF